KPDESPCRPRVCAAVYTADRRPLCATRSQWGPDGRRLPRGLQRGPGAGLRLPAGRPCIPIDALAAGPAKAADPSAPLYLDDTAVHMPSAALACAARETLHMGDVVGRMLRHA